MDIDDFLDKELKAVSGRVTSTAPPKKKKSLFGSADVPEKVEQDVKELPEDSDELHELADQEPLQAMKSDIADKHYLDLDKHYNALWDLVVHQKFQWNKQLYEKVAQSHDEINKAMEPMKALVAQSKQNIRDLIQQMHDALNRNDHQKALGLYNTITELQENFPTIFTHDYHDISKEILEMYTKLHEQIDKALMQDVKQRLLEIESLVNSAHANARMGKIQLAQNSYTVATQLFQGLPHGFIPRKIEIGSKLVAVYKELSIRNQLQELRLQLASVDREAFKKPSSHEDIRMQRLANLARASAEASPIDSHKKSLIKQLLEKKIHRAQLLIKEGKTPAAQKDLASVLKMDPGNAEAKALMEKISVAA